MKKEYFGHLDIKDERQIREMEEEINALDVRKKNKKLKEVVKNIPLERIVLETDCPYIAPVPNRGKRNSSLYLPYVVSAIADIKGVTKEEVISVTEENGLKLYRMIWTINLEQ